MGSYKIDALREIITRRVHDEHFPGPDEAVEWDEKEIHEQIERELRTAIVAGVKP